MVLRTHPLSYPQSLSYMLGSVASGTKETPSPTPSLFPGEAGGLGAPQGGWSLGMLESVPSCFYSCRSSCCSHGRESPGMPSPERKLRQEKQTSICLCLGGLCARGVTWEEPYRLRLGQAVALCQVPGVPIETVPGKLGCKVTGSSVNTLNIYLKAGCHSQGGSQ